MTIICTKRPSLIGFSEACYNDNTIEELIACLESDQPDTIDCAAWNLSDSEWRTSIGDALRAKIFDLDGR